MRVRPELFPPSNSARTPNLCQGIRTAANSKWKGLFLHRAVHRQHEPAQFRRGAVFLRCAFTLKLTLFYCQLKRESNGNTVTIRPGGLSFRLSEPIESHKCDHPDERPITPRWLTRTILDSRPLLNRWTTSDANLMLNTPALVQSWNKAPRQDKSCRISKVRAPAS
jgi:hypothetical protein